MTVPELLASLTDEQLIGELARRGRWLIERHARRFEVEIVEAGVAHDVRHDRKHGAVVCWGHVGDLAELEEGTTAVLEITGGPR